MAPDDSVDYRQVHSGTSTRFFRGKERLEDPFHISLVYAMTGVAHRQQNAKTEIQIHEV